MLDFQDLAITAADIDAAAEVLAPFAVRTPLLSSPRSMPSPAPASISSRDAPAHRLVQIPRRFQQVILNPEVARRNGVVAFSSGNHAQGVAAAAQILNMRATIVMPSDAPVAKRERTAGYGAEVVLYDRDREDREAIARAIAARSDATLVPPYDDPHVIAGQGTVGREIAEDLAAQGLVPDIIVAPASGGGLIAGTAIAVKARFPQVHAMSAEPQAYDDHALSLQTGRRQPHNAQGRTICDALMAAIPGEITFAINQRLLTRGVTATDAEVAKAVALVFRELKLVVEPGGAVALAALLADRIDARGKTVVIVLSGGNVDADLFARLIKLRTAAKYDGEERDLLGLGHAPDRRQHAALHRGRMTDRAAGNQRRAKRRRRILRRRDGIDQHRIRRFVGGNAVRPFVRHRRRTDLRRSRFIDDRLISNGLIGDRFISDGLGPLRAERLRIE